MGHAKKSPSSSKRWMTCPGSVGLIDSLDITSKPSKYTAEGSVAHWVGEESLLNDKQPKEYIGQKRTEQGFTFTITKPMVEAVDEYVDYIHDAIDMTANDVEMGVEVKCSLKSLNVKDMDGGTTDCILICKAEKWIEIIDYKHGQGVVVEPDWNSQAMQYALGALIEHGIIEFDWMVRITIVQPRAFHPKGGIRSWDTTSGELFDWSETTLIPAGKACDKPDAPLVPSDDGCRFCAAAGQCSALYNRTQEIAVVDFAEEELPDPRLMTLEQKKMVMDHADVIRSFIVAVEKQIKDEVEAGSQEYVGKYKLVKKTKHRQFEEDAFDPDFSPIFDYISEQDTYTKKQKSVGDIQSSIRTAMGTLKGKTAKLKEIMDEITYKPEGELVIAPQSDKRREVQPSLISDFTDLDD